MIFVLVWLIGLEENGPYCLVSRKCKTWENLHIIWVKIWFYPKIKLSLVVSANFNSPFASFFLSLSALCKKISPIFLLNIFMQSVSQQLFPVLDVFLCVWQHTICSLTLPLSEHIHSDFYWRWFHVHTPYWWHNSKSTWDTLFRIWTEKLINPFYIFMWYNGSINKVTVSVRESHPGLWA